MSTMTWTHPGAPVPIPASLVGIDEFAELNKGNSDFGEMMRKGALFFKSKDGSVVDNADMITSSVRQRSRLCLLDR